MPVFTEATIILLVEFIEKITSRPSFYRVHICEKLRFDKHFDFVFGRGLGVILVSLGGGWNIAYIRLPSLEI